MLPILPVPARLAGITPLSSKRLENNMKRWFGAAAVVVLMGVAGTGCGPAPDEVPSTTEAAPVDGEVQAQACPRGRVGYWMCPTTEQTFEYQSCMAPPNQFAYQVAYNTCNANCSVTCQDLGAAAQ